MTSAFATMTKLDSSMENCQPPACNSLRRWISRLKDDEILRLVWHTQRISDITDRKYRDDNASEEDFEGVYSAKEIQTVASAIGKKRLLNGGNGHRHLRDSRLINLDPKRETREFGKMLHEKRVG
jgi:hypothetical protein